MIPDKFLYWFADTTGLPLKQTAQRVTGTGKLKVPLFDKVRLQCDLAVVASMYRSRHETAAICLHVRQDLYLVLMVNESAGGQASLHVLDATKIEQKMTDLFKTAHSFHAVEKRMAPGQVRFFVWDKKRHQWKNPIVDRVGGSKESGVPAVVPT